MVKSLGMKGISNLVQPVSDMKGQLPDLLHIDKFETSGKRCLNRLPNQTQELCMGTVVDYRLNTGLIDSLSWIITLEACKNNCKFWMKYDQKLQYSLEVYYENSSLENGIVQCKKIIEHNRVVGVFLSPAESDSRREKKSQCYCVTNRFRIGLQIMWVMNRLHDRDLIVSEL